MVRTNLIKDNPPRLQVTGYGLGGLVEVHSDAYGYNEGVELSDDKR